MSALILVVEDEEQVRALIVRLLVKRGYRVLQAPNGRAAIEIAEPQISAISLVITDLVMPEMGGADLLMRLRARRADLPFLFMTGYTKEEVLNGEPLADAHFLEKPFTPRALLDCVEDLVNGVV